VDESPILFVSTLKKWRKLKIPSIHYFMKNKLFHLISFKTRNLKRKNYYEYLNIIYGAKET